MITMLTTTSLILLLVANVNCHSRQPMTVALTHDVRGSSQASQSSSGCGKALPEGIHLDESKNQTLEGSKSGVSTRKYRIHVPKSYKVDTAVPLIFSFHGRGKDMLFQEELSQFSNASYGFEGIAVYPEGVPYNGKTKQWQGDPDSHGIDDVTFTLELLDAISGSYCIDTARVYAAGKSNGGGFTGGVLACDADATEKIAAFAPVSGAFYLEKSTQELPPCTPTSSRKTIPILEYHGWVDGTIPYEGGLNDRGNANSTNIVKWVDGWAKRNGFKVDANVTTHLCNDDPSKLVTKYSWNDIVIHYNMSNLGHVWPSSFPNVDTSKTTCKDAEATSNILSWFAKWSL